MHKPRSLRRSALLALSLLSGCAAAGTAVRADDMADHGKGADVADYLVGKVAGQEGDLDYAADAFLRAVAADPSDPELKQQAFLACLLSDRPEAESLARAQPQNPLAQLLLADTAAQRGQWDDAERRFAAIPRQGSIQILMPILVAWSQAGAGHPDAALATLRPYVEGPRSRGIYALHAALIADLAQRDPEASRLYHLAQTSFGDLDLDLARTLASWQARRGDRAGADRLLQTLAQDSPDLAIALPALERDVDQRQVRRATDGIADAYLALAAVLRAQDGSEYAALLLRLALHLRPDLTAARLLSSELMSETKRPEQALRELQSIQHTDPLAALVDLRRAGLLDRVGRADAALALLGRMEQTFPDRPEPWAMQGGLLREQHRYAEAVAAYDQAVARVPNPTRANWPLFYERGIALERANRWPEAEADFRHALVLSPDESVVLNYLAYSWTEKGTNLAEARQMLQRAVSRRPNDGAMLDSLGWVELRQGNTAEAVRDLEHAVELEPEDATINGHLGDAYSAAGRTREAEFQWQRALTFNPEPDEARRIQDRLREAGLPALAPAAASAADPKAIP